MNAKTGWIVVSLVGVIALVAISVFGGLYTSRPSAARTQIVSTAGLPKGVQVDLPRNVNNTDRDPEILKESSAIVSIPSDDRIYVGSELTPQEALGSKLSRFLELQKEPNKIVYLAVGADVDYGAVVKVIYQLRNQDVDRVGLMTGGKPDSKYPYRILVQIPAGPKPIELAGGGVGGLSIRKANRVCARTFYGINDTDERSYLGCGRLEDFA